MDDMSPYHDIFEAVERLMDANRKTKLRQFQPGGGYVLFAKKGMTFYCTFTLFFGSS
jgi:hypothetical protein